ncbi:trypsin-like serine protease [Piscinibacter sakaiensis]|uniref:trypsin-like serine protease n=1 Tax=Piscinibacter sakaiensis TaxID=1547922 RepID=UPI003AAEB7BB
MGFASPLFKALPRNTSTQKIGRAPEFVSGMRMSSMNPCHIIVRLSPLRCLKKQAMPLLFVLLAWVATPGLALTAATTAPANAYAHIGNVGGTSGVLIAPNWVLTAAHNISGSVLGSFESEAGTSNVLASYKYPGHSYPSHDIGLLYLATSLNAGGAFPLLNSTAIGQSQVRGLGPVTLTSAKRGTAGRPVTGVGSVALALDTVVWEGATHTPNWLITSGPVYVEGGDSGGGLFMGNVDSSSNAVLLGVTTTLLGGGGFNSSGHVQTAPYMPWINSTIRSVTPGQAAQWTMAVSPVPEPPAVLMMALGLGFLYRRRKHTRAAFPPH